jgi:hypothetical protein
VSKNHAAWLALGLLAGCAVGAPEPVVHGRVPYQGPAFDANAARYMLEQGPNVIEGQAVVRDRSGALATCAGDEATLVPDTAYTRARLKALYGGHRNYAEISTAPRLRRDARYEAYVRHTPCDNDGHFRFGQVADGRYVVIAAVHREGEGRAGGTSIRQSVAVHGGGINDVELTR